MHCCMPMGIAQRQLRTASAPATGVAVRPQRRKIVSGTAEGLPVRRQGGVGRAAVCALAAGRGRPAPAH